MIRDPMSQRDQWGERLPRKLGTAALVGVVISLTIGSGIFRVPATIAELLRSPTAIIGIWVLGGAIALAGALSLAELGAAFPRSGGYFVALHETYGAAPAFVYGWAELVVMAPSGMGAISFIFAQYLAYFVPLSPRGVQLIAAALVILASLLAYIGVRLASVVAGLSTSTKYVGIALLVVFAFLGGHGTTTNFAPAPMAGGATAFLTALLAVMFTYDGWGDGMRLAGEVRNPTRTLPRAMALAVGLVAAIYVTVNLAYLYLVPAAEMAASPLVASTAAERIPVLGRAGGGLVAMLVMVSTFGCVCASALAYPRTQFAMADRGLFFPTVARVSPRFGTPSVATSIICAISIVFIFMGSFQRLADQMVLGFWPFYVLNVAGVIVLRRRRPDLERPYRVWGYPFVPLFFLAAGLAMMGNAIVSAPASTAVTFGLLATGVPAYFLWRRLGGGARTRAHARSD